MIIVNDKNIENTVNFPKNLYNIQNDSDITLSSYNVVLKNRATNKTYEYNILDDLYKFSHDFYSFNLDFSKLPDDEYEYKIFKNIYKYIQQKITLDVNHYYYLDYNIGDEAPESSTYTTQWGCQRIEVQAGSVININTIRRSSVRAYALTDENRIIYDIAPKYADYTSGITLTAQKDGYLYLNYQKNNIDTFEGVVNIPTIEDDVYVASGIIKIKGHQTKTIYYDKNREYITYDKQNN